jgi:hypothetical protein
MWPSLSIYVETSAPKVSAHFRNAASRCQLTMCCQFSGRLLTSEIRNFKGNGNTNTNLKIAVLELISEQSVRLALPPSPVAG